jgi:hypothetical protein
MRNFSCSEMFASCLRIWSRASSSSAADGISIFNERRFLFGGVNILRSCRAEVPVFCGIR